MRYFYDTEFIEDSKTIDLISIGIVAEDGRELYAQSCEFDMSKASSWVMSNVVANLQFCMTSKDRHTGKCMRAHCPWRTREEIKAEILAFMDIETYGHPELWSYYSAYDHVAFCQLFGTMMDLPKGYPMYTRDLKQWFDVLSVISNPQLPEQEQGEHHALADARHNRVMYEYLASFSKYV